VLDLRKHPDLVLFLPCAFDPGFLGVGSAPSSFGLWDFDLLLDWAVSWRISGLSILNKTFQADYHMNDSSFMFCGDPHVRLREGKYQFRDSRGTGRVSQLISDWSRCVECQRDS
jgi:hypothetical protein